MSQYNCPDCQDSGWITTRTWPKMTYVAPGPAPEDARGVMTLRCDCGILAKESAAFDMADIDEAIQDAICDDEGRLTPRSLLHHLAKRGIVMAHATLHDCPRPVERLIPAGPSPRGHRHVWGLGENPGDPFMCRECGELLP